MPKDKKEHSRSIGFTEDQLMRISALAKKKRRSFQDQVAVLLEIALILEESSIKEWL